MAKGNFSAWQRQAGEEPDEGLELLDWDAAIEKEPVRPSGVLLVTLEYAGRATPSPTSLADDASGVASTGQAKPVKMTGGESVV